MKKQILFMCALLVAQVSLTLAQVTTPPPSPKEIVIHELGLTEIKVTYHSPRVRERVVYGGIVPYDQVWRCGANENTVIEFGDDVKVEGKDLKAGTYGLHMIPGQDKWTIIFSKNSTSWGSFSYNQDEDALRVEVTPSEAPHSEALKYSFVDYAQNGVSVALNWEKLQVAFKVESDVHEIVLANIRNELRGSKGFTRQGWLTAANYCVSNNINLEEGLQWVNTAITGNFGNTPGFTSYITKSRILGLQGKEAESKEAAKQALDIGTVFQLHGYGRLLISQKKIDDALEVFKMNAKRNPDTWPINVGLARGYSAKGDYKTALKHAKLALNNVPANDNVNKNNLENVIKLLEQGKDIN